MPGHVLKHEPEIPLICKYLGSCIIHPSRRLFYFAEWKTGDLTVEILGTNLRLYSYAAKESITNRHFSSLPGFNSIYLPENLTALNAGTPDGSDLFIEDDNRGAISPEPVANIDGTDFHLSVKGIGSTTDPFSLRLLDPEYVASLTGIAVLRDKIRKANGVPARFITGELWLRGSPYGGQGLEHAATALRVSEMADITSINGFRIAPVIRVVPLPEDMEMELKKIYWYRRFSGRIVQEIRLVPSNIRVYFHAGNVIGRNIRRIFDMFRVESNDRAYEFECNYIRSCIALLTLFPRTMAWKDNGRYTGLDFNDVWLDKDAVISPDGTVYFVDLEGLEERTVDADHVLDKIEEQLHRSLYEFMFAYEQIEHERASRFGGVSDRRTQFRILVREALRNDPFIDVSDSGGSLILTIKNKLNEENLNKSFAIVDGDTL